jgi:hypothetical protein
MFLDYSNSADQLKWSPEIEYSFMDGHAIELELPVENTTLSQYKVSLQGTWGELFQGRMITDGKLSGEKK